MKEKHENKFHILNDDLFKQMFVNHKTKRTVWHFSLYVLIFVAIFSVVFAVANFPSLYKQINYWYSYNYKNDNVDPKLISLESNLNSKDVSLDFVNSNVPEFNDNQIYIPEIDVDAPIIWNVQNLESETSARLEEGTVHLAGTALPGQKGNVFITGHSSNYIWSKGSYKDVFSLINHLVVGDFIYLKYQNKIFVYKIDDIETVKPTDLSVLNQEGKNRLTLMTCTPVGTTLNRLILSAKQIFPSPDQNSQMQNQDDLGSLPSIR